MSTLSGNPTGLRNMFEHRNFCDMSQPVVAYAFQGNTRSHAEACVSDRLQDGLAKS